MKCPNCGYIGSMSDCGDSPEVPIGLQCPECGECIADEGNDDDPNLEYWSDYDEGYDDDMGDQVVHRPYDDIPW